LNRSEAIFVESIREGDIAAFTTLVDQYKQMVYRLAVQVTKNHEDAMDVMQETFIKVYRSIHKFRMDSSFETWLYRIVVNLSLNALKKHNRLNEKKYSLEDVENSKKLDNLAATSAVIQDRSNPHVEVEKRELREAVGKAVASLPLHQRTVVILHEFEGLTHSQIASVMGCSEGTIRSRLHYARKRLKELLRPYI
jgi:RNA polymerase sigma-70 factor (ECF subfamily)